RERTPAHGDSGMMPLPTASATSVHRKGRSRSLASGTKFGPPKTDWGVSRRIGSQFGKQRCQSASIWESLPVPENKSTETHGIIPRVSQLAIAISLALVL